MITSITIALESHHGLSDARIAGFLSGRQGWSVVTGRWPVLAAGVHVVRSPCIGAMVSLDARGSVTISAYPGTVLGALNPLAFILYKSEMMDHAKEVSACITELVATAASEKVPTHDAP